jgi:crotonobetainyl-CoA:carnitine CoA-transferase CaiB-like acyl-CoA transferase
MSVLSSLKILDFSTLLPGPFATMWLADMGADIVRVEAPNRPDPGRTRPPIDGGVSAGHGHLQRSKRSVALDLKVPGSAEIVKRLVEDYDILLEQFRPGVMDRLGIGYESLSAVNPKLIYCALTGYGQTGPMKDRAGHDLNYLSLAGVMGTTGRADSGPVPAGVQIADVGGGSLPSVIGMLAAVIHRGQTGEGQFVDVSMYDSSISWNCQVNPAYLVAGQEMRYEEGVLNGGFFYDCYETSDGRHMSVGSLEPKFWIGLCESLGIPEVAVQVTEPGPGMKPVREAIANVFKTKTQKEWVEIFAKVDVCVEPVLFAGEALSHPHAIARDMIVDVPKPDGTMQKQTGAPIKFSKSPPVFKHIGSKMGEHTVDVLGAAGYSAAEIASFNEAGIFGDTVNT